MTEVIGSAPETREDSLDSLMIRPFRTRVIGTILALGIAFFTAGLVILINQNREINEKNGQIEEMRQKLEMQSGRLAALVQAGQSGNPAATQAARVQAEQIQAELLADQSPSAVTTPPASLAAGQNVTVAAGPSFGWDVDVFWCEGPDSAGDQGVARAASLVLGQAAASRRPIGPGVVLGKISLRSWPEKFREGTIKGTSVIADSGSGENSARDVIADTLNAKTGFRFEKRSSVGKPTRFYISVYACNGWKHESAASDGPAVAEAK